MKGGPRDIGCTIFGALSRIAGGRSWLDAGKVGYFECRESASNGSLMRNGLIGYIPSDTHTAFTLSMKQCLITHYSPLPVLCCCAQTYIIRLLLEGMELSSQWREEFRREWLAWSAEERDPVVRDWLSTVGDTLSSAWRDFMEADFDPESFDPFVVMYSGRSGYCLLTLQIAVWVLHRSSTREGVRIPEAYPAEVFTRRGPWALGWAAMLGYDSDTYCATAGPMISARYGGLPEELVSGLMVHDWM
jgi:ADP-ribosylglycohydrolase